MIAEYVGVGLVALGLLLWIVSARQGDVDGVPAFLFGLALIALGVMVVLGRAAVWFFGRWFA
jgi:hypothetical protein